LLAKLPRYRRKRYLCSALSGASVDYLINAALKQRAKEARFGATRKKIIPHYQHAVVWGDDRSWHAARM
jgi:hypothetical protein